MLAIERVARLMAIHEQLRENLLRDATAYRRRLALRCDLQSTLMRSAPAEIRSEQPDPRPTRDKLRREVFFGIRDSGAWSLYVDQDPVLQFTPQNALRRLYWKGQRYAAKNARLQLLLRQTVGGRVQFDEQFLTPVDEQAIVAGCRELLHAIAAQVRGGCYVTIGQVPAEDAQLVDELLRVLCQVEHGFRLAGSLSP